MKEPAPALEPFVRQRTVLLTTYRRDGTPVGTPVHIAVDGDRAFVRTWDAAWKLRRIRNDPEVEVAPSTALGKPTGPGIQARARVLGGVESAYAGRALARKYPILHTLLVPLVHRLRGNETVHIELTPVESGVSAHRGRSLGSTAAAPLTSSSPRSGARGQVACEPRGG